MSDTGRRDSGEIPFSVDSALLRELGERLVGKPYIALAELVKNSYDADAHEVRIEFEPNHGRIEVWDDGHGMTFDEFRDFWMRIGTPHKVEKRLSKYLQRRMTGSKGVGRLAVQFLAQELTLWTIPQNYDGQWLEAYVDWAKAVKAGDLTHAKVAYTIETSPPPIEHGTYLVLGKLKHTWGLREIQDLARELWWLQPPFRAPPRRGRDSSDLFSIDFRSSEGAFEETFEGQMKAILGIWTARLAGRNENGHVSLSLEFAGGTPRTYSYAVADFPHNKPKDEKGNPIGDGIYDPAVNLEDGEFEIRIYTLRSHQPRGIRVSDARDYFAKFGGVHVYDSGFRLPYYGRSESDWLGIEVDHSHRLVQSSLLPGDLQQDRSLTGGLSYLPTLERMFGVVNVDTSRERNLDIMITRDRLAATRAYEDLSKMVRYAIDLYAMEEARRQYQEKIGRAPIDLVPQTFEQLEKTLGLYRSEIPDRAYTALERGVRDVAKVAKLAQDRVRGEAGMLGALATAGIQALAYQHELRKLFIGLDGLIETIQGIQTDDEALQDQLALLETELSSWLARARATNALFNYVADAETATTRRRFHAIRVLSEIRDQTAFLARGIEVDLDPVARNLLLPEASLAEWGAIFQNVFTNAFTAMLDSEERLLQASTRLDGRHREVLIQDTGVGVDLADAERLFQPFERGIEISPERRGLGYGGTGLGLTIVRMVADRIGCRVGFIEPDRDFNTAFSIRWRETK